MVSKREGRDNLRDSSIYIRIILKMNIKEIVLDWIHLAQDRI
jgi:hypothetical protein